MATGRDIFYYTKCNIWITLYIPALRTVIIRYWRSHIFEHEKNRNKEDRFKTFPELNINNVAVNSHEGHRGDKPNAQMKTLIEKSIALTDEQQKVPEELQFINTWGKCPQISSQGSTRKWIRSWKPSRTKVQTCLSDKKWYQVDTPTPASLISSVNVGRHFYLSVTFVSI